MRRRDDLAIHNERVKLIAAISTAVGLAFFGLGFARPVVDDTVPSTPMAAFSVLIGVVGVAGAYIALGYLRTDKPKADDRAERETQR